MITLYFAPMTRSIRIMWLLEEMALPYRLEPRAFNADGERGFAQATPSGKFPVIVDANTVVSESGAIVQYLVERYDDGKFAPPIGSPLRGRYLHWLHFIEATVAAPINSYVWLAVYRSDAAANADIIGRFRDAAHQHFDLIETALMHDDFLVGDSFSAADVMMGFTLWSARMLRLLTDAHPRTSAYLDRLLARPGFAKAIAESKKLAHS
ncbi:glutathione S-transferase family protein [Sphingomonas oligophenolica]|uniref:Glutathione S-transferase family protein n=1 Tax=Sphingomonas oligophenolica TaxID=301154 RepID=A0A502CG45_9SPHN|nr:glutathione S-transferase family protein [Sphingomonas oligophenolica]TPG12695.1 glutathione S-transferase family protein [Sphingomonas oligophenolica]